jgi:hypothetical protein
MRLFSIEHVHCMLLLLLFFASSFQQRHAFRVFIDHQVKLFDNQIVLIFFPFKQDNLSLVFVGLLFRWFYFCVFAHESWTRSSACLLLFLFALVFFFVFECIHEIFHVRSPTQSILKWTWIFIVLIDKQKISKYDHTEWKEIWSRLTEQVCVCVCVTDDWLMSFDDETAMTCGMLSRMADLFNNFTWLISQVEWDDNCICCSNETEQEQQ